MGILDEPELHLSDNVLVPDLAGWRRARLPEAPNHRGERLRYATERVSHLWFVNPATQTFEVLGLEGANYRILDVFEGNSAVRAVPFDAIELERGVLWAH